MIVTCLYAGLFGLIAFFIYARTLINYERQPSPNVIAIMYIVCGVMAAIPIVLRNFNIIPSNMNTAILAILYFVVMTLGAFLVGFTADKLRR